MYSQYIPSGKSYTVNGNALNNVISAESMREGYHTVYGLGGNDIIRGSYAGQNTFDGNDILNGNEGNDTIYGNSGNDRIFGSEGNDTLYGGAGNDIIYGGTGTDYMFGNAGNDTFSFEVVANDKIRDFAQGDKINLSIIDANTGVAGNQAFSYIGKATFTKAGQLHIVDQANGVRIELNMDADNTAEASLDASTKSGWDAGDFIL